MKNKVSLIVLCLCLVGLAACNPSGGDTPPTEEIVIGEYGSLTGEDATFGGSTKNGIEIAVDEVNAAGGLLGKKVRVIVEDDQGKAEEAQIVVTKLITKDRVVAVLGEVASSRSLAAAPVAQQYGVPMISPSSTNVEVTRKGDYIFRVCFLDPFQGYVMAKFATNTLKITKVAVLRDIKSDYSVGLANAFIENFQKMGGTIVGDESYSAGDTDFNAQLTSIKARGPQAIFVPGYYTAVGLIARQAKKQGINVPLLGGDGWDSPKLTEIGGKDLDGAFFTNHYSVDDPSPEAQRFLAAYKARFNTVPDALGGLAYDSAMVLFEAIKRAGSTDGKAIRDEIARTKDHSGVTGKITLNSERNADKPAVVLEIKEGKFVYRETINPES
ncbi:MAG TPA: ABC transporter substrate-binding protein [Terriglobia bacterium]|nr:ABC transporter substrate-binding protein [Terriglobia bacterium]